MTFTHNGKFVTFKGIRKPPLKIVDQNQIVMDAKKRRQGVLLQVSAITSISEKESEGSSEVITTLDKELHQELDTLLSTFA